MEEIKRRFEFYSYNDCTGIENHLKKMAEKGWMLDDIGVRRWKYRRIEPSSLSYEIVYHRETIPSVVEKKRFIDEHSVSGWKFVADIGKMYVFVNENENPVPMHTDAAERVKEIHRFAKSNMIWENLFMLAVAVAVTVYFAFRFFKEPIDTMSDAAYMFWSVPFAIPLSLYSIFKYLFWYAKAKKAADDGIFAETKRIINYANFYVPLYLSSSFLKIYTFLSPYQMIFGVIAFAFAVLLWVVFKALRRGIIRKDVADNKKKAITAVTAVILVAGFVAGSFGIYSLFPKRSEKFKRKSEYSNNMINVTVYHDKNLPLDLEDMIDADGIVSKYKSNEWLGFVNKKETSQFVLDKENTDFYCDIYYINFQPLYDACVEEIKGIFKDDYVSVDPAPWGANKVYRIKYDDGYGNRFVICWGDRIAELVFSWDPTDEQIAIESQKILESHM